jgi:uncharacterized protein (DUF433 family)
MNLPDFLSEDRYGLIHLTGHRVGLRHIIDLYKDRYSADLLQDQFPTISLALIYKTIAFYLENASEVDAYIERSRAILQEQAAVARGPDADELRRRMDARKPKESA